MSKYCLLGEHLGHSFSAIIHNYIYKRLNLDNEYTLREEKKEDIINVVNDLKNGTLKGINVTIPYKVEIMKYLDYISDEAKKIGAVNTVKSVNGKLYGYNTDYMGFEMELNHFNVSPKNKKTYILGNGGASKAVIQLFIDKNYDFEIVARSSHGYDVISYEEFEKRCDKDIVINCTPVGMYPNIDNIVVSEESLKDSIGVDLIYNPLETKFMKSCKEGYNGLYMLVGQAVRAFEIWEDIKIDFIDEIFEYVKEAI